jgi:serine/threonine protein kinase
VGTLDYMAPEVVVCPDKVHPNDHKEKTHLHYTYLVDAWAVGVLAYELTVGRAPFDAGHKRGTIDNILHAQVSPQL